MKDDRNLTLAFTVFVLLLLAVLIIQNANTKDDGYMLREEVAVVALRVKYGTDYTPPPATGDIFADMVDTDYWGTQWAEAAYLDGLFAGCGEEDGKPLFCPGGGE